MHLVPVGTIFSVAIFVFSFKERGLMGCPLLLAMLNAPAIPELGESAFAGDVWKGVVGTLNPLKSLTL